MIQVSSKINIIDNSGAKYSKVIRILGGNRTNPAKLGSTLVITVKKARSNAKIKKGEVHKLKILRGKNLIRRKDGTILNFDNNGGVILNEQLAPVASRIFGPLARELKKNHGKMTSLAKKMY